ncbi:protein AF-9 [Etheostoma spectabile]|uniref:protein AF-9 n=1 Tax=Etheostoma spectabile TaxID=54343 RepID=UPI0013AF8071|nr:protein AF-9-like [Etheostoma spectabile]
MENQCTLQVKLEWGHGVQLRKKVTSEGYTHDWMVYVRGLETSDIQHFAEKVVFHLHEIFPNPREELPKKMCFKYQLNLEGDHLRCETLTFNNPTKEFRRKLIKAGGEPSKEGSNGSSQSSQADGGASLLALKRLRAKQTTEVNAAKNVYSKRLPPAAPEVSEESTLLFSAAIHLAGKIHHP